MVRAPCCEKMGLKKGPWTQEEDRILVSYIQKHGHGNWRALPKLAGLLRCGKSCRLRWINYLRPDIKRGNYTKEEEETIIKLHEKIGNKWSAIAAKLPGRTDNEIKNVWHTRLKKRVLKQKQDIRLQRNVAAESESESTNSIQQTLPGLIEIKGYAPMSPQPSSSNQSSFSITDISVNAAQTNNIGMVNAGWETMDWSDILPVIDENGWSEPESVMDSSVPSNFLDQLHFQFPYTDVFDSTRVADDGMDFWYDILIYAGGKQELL